MNREAGRTNRRAIWLATIALLIICDLPIAQNELIFWALTAAIIAFVLFVERRPLSSIGLVRATWKTPVFGIAAGLVMTAVIAAIYLVVYPLLHQQPDVGGNTGPAATVPLWLNFAIVVRAAVFEEVYYRGFAIERLTELTGMRWLAAVISFAAFTLAHLYTWSWAHLLVAGAGGAVLTALYLWKRDLLCNMIAHFTTDAIGFLLL